MKRFNQFLRKYRWPITFAIAISATGFMLFVWQMTKFGNALTAKTYVEYVKYFYLPEQRRKTGKWPATLNELPQENPAKRFDGEEVLQTHRRLFQSFEAIKSDRKSYTYVLHLRNYDVKCTSYLTEKENEAGECTYTEK